MTETNEETTETPSQDEGAQTEQASSELEQENAKLRDQLDKARKESAARRVELKEVKGSLEAAVAAQEEASKTQALLDETRAELLKATKETALSVAGIPLDFVGSVTGETREEIAKSVEGLKSHFPSGHRTAQGFVGGLNGESKNSSNMSPSEYTQRIRNGR